MISFELSKTPKFYNKNIDGVRLISLGYLRIDTVGAYLLEKLYNAMFSKIEFEKKKNLKLLNEIIVLDDEICDLKKELDTFKILSRL